MIIVNELHNTDTHPTTYKVSAFADTKSEVQTATLADYKGLPSDATAIEMGSSVMTAAGEMAFMKSDGNWNWI